MYDFSYALEPAAEGIQSFFGIVFNKIKDAGTKIRQWMNKISSAIKRRMGSVDKSQVIKDSSEVLNKIKAIGNDIEKMLDTCSKQIDILLNAWLKVANKVEIKADAKIIDNYEDKGNGKANYKKPVYTEDGKHYSVKGYGASGGMDIISKDVKKDSAAYNAWEAKKQEIALALTKTRSDAETIAANLKSLSSYGPLSVNATKQGYDELRAIFDANGTFGDHWKKVKIAAEWSTGYIKETLSRVVSVYDVGIKATDSFGARLTRGFIRNENGEALSKEDRKDIQDTYKGITKVHQANKSSRDISSNNIDAFRTATKKPDVPDSSKPAPKTNASTATSPNMVLTQQSTTNKSSNSTTQSNKDAEKSTTPNMVVVQNSDAKSTSTKNSVKTNASRDTKSKGTSKTSSTKKGTIGKGKGKNKTKFTERVGNAVGNVAADIASRARKLFGAHDSVGYNLDDLYQMAYEDAMCYIMDTNEIDDFCDDINNVYDFVEEGIGITYDPEFDFVYIDE